MFACHTSFQELVSLNPFNLLVPNHSSHPWEDRVRESLGSDYVLVQVEQQVGLMLSVFVRRKLFPYITDIQTCTTGLGFLGIGVS